MTGAIRKIRNRAGETIAETLIALLIAALALVMLAAAISTVSGIITRSSDKIDKYYDENENLVKGSGDSGGSMTLETSGSASTPGLSATISVHYGSNNVLNSSSPVIAFDAGEKTTSSGGNSGSDSGGSGSTSNESNGE